MPGGPLRLNCARKEAAVPRGVRRGVVLPRGQRVFPPGRNPLSARWRNEEVVLVLDDAGTRPPKPIGIQ